MSKVLVDRELLSRIAAHLEWDGTGFKTAAEFAADCDGLCKELSDYLAQPAEAEGADIVAWLLEGGRFYRPSVVTTEGEADRRIAERKDETVKSPLVRQSTLSAVTAERDRLLQELAKSETNTMALMVKHFAGSMTSREQDRKLDECLSEGIAMLEAERDQLRAEVEMLREALEQIAAGERLVERFDASGSCTDSEVENDTTIDYPGIAKAALAAKEA